MRFAKKMQLNIILKISFKSFIISLILLTIALDLGIYLSKIKAEGWIINSDGRVAIYGSNYGLFISNYFLSFSTVINLFALFFMVLGIVRHRQEAKGKVQSYPVGIFILLAQIFNLIAFFCVALPTTKNAGSLPWESVVFSKIIIPIFFFLYVMVFMENKSWYGVREMLLRCGLRVFFIFIGVIVVYYLLWLSKYIGKENDNIFMLRKTEEISSDQLLAAIHNVGKNIPASILDHIEIGWNNHDVLNSDLLFHFSHWESSIMNNVGEWIGVIFALTIFFGLAFGIIPLLALLNKAVVSSPRYLVYQDANDHTSRVIDLRDDVDTIDFSEN